MRQDDEMAHIGDTLRSESLVFGVERLGKECSACGKVKPVEEFARQRGGKYGWRSQCKKCLAPSKAAYRKENRGKARVSESSYRAKRRMQLQALAPVSRVATISMRKLNLRKKHNLSVEEYEEMYRNQGGSWAICDTPESSKKRLSIDHNHANGTVRGLLCQQCNIGIGQFQDDVLRLESAIAYLQKFSQA